jgi:hypothetical protein
MQELDRHPGGRRLQWKATSSRAISAMVGHGRASRALSSGISVFPRTLPIYLLSAIGAPIYRRVGV